MNDKKNKSKTEAKNKTRLDTYSFKSSTLAAPLSQYEMRCGAKRSEALRSLIALGLAAYNNELAAPGIVFADKAHTYTERASTLTALSNSIRALARTENAVRQLNTELYSADQKNRTFTELNRLISDFGDMHQKILSTIVAAFSHIPIGVASHVLKQDKNEWVNNDVVHRFVRDLIILEDQK